MKQALYIPGIAATLTVMVWWNHYWPTRLNPTNHSRIIAHAPAAPPVNGGSVSDFWCPGDPRCIARVELKENAIHPEGKPPINGRGWDGITRESMSFTCNLVAFSKDGDIEADSTCDMVMRKAGDMGFRLANVNFWPKQNRATLTLTRPVEK